ncbi:MAG: hypothetical protein IJH31_00130 [Erysipelotrichaceae bacterium]|nr:hypothetical protein [Erysipelotrichaceae bacterium]
MEEIKQEMKVGTVVICPHVSKEIEGKLNPLYATIYLSPHKSIDRNFKTHNWYADVRTWKVAGFIDIKALQKILSDKLDEISGKAK